MVLTCHACPRRLACSGRASRIVRLAALFGWRLRASGEGWHCPDCGRISCAN
jgi:hypothetical protein